MNFNAAFNILGIGFLAILGIRFVSSLLTNHSLKFLTRIASAAVFGFMIIGILMTFESVRSHAAGLLTSVGLISIMLGLAAKGILNNCATGIQIALARPLLVDDVVVVGKDKGRVEEIHFTYVVVKLSDLRRLIVPITYFTNYLFENWTRKTIDMLGTVVLHVSYTMPIETLRNELDIFLEGNSLWNREYKGIQVTDATEKTMEIRITTSSYNSDSSALLNHALREHMVSFIQKNYPHCLPRVHLEYGIC